MNVRLQRKRETIKKIVVSDQKIKMKTKPKIQLIRRLYKSLINSGEKVFVL